MWHGVRREGAPCTQLCDGLASCMLGAALIEYGFLLLGQAGTNVIWLAVLFNILFVLTMLMAEGFRACRPPAGGKATSLSPWV